MHQAPHALFQTGFNHVFGDQYIVALEVLITPPSTPVARTVHHGIDIDAQVAHQQAIGQITRDKFSTTAYQVFNTLGPSPADPHVKALLQGKARKASAYEAARAGDQNLHESLQCCNSCCLLFKRYLSQQRH